MESGNNKNNEQDRRNEERRAREDRRVVVRFEDILGRRSGVERRVTVTNLNGYQDN